MERTHASHIAIGGCLRKARKTLYWPRMSTELRDMVSKCDVCLKFRKTPTKEPLLSHEVGSRPWSKLGADLAEQDGRQVLVVVDYFSNYIEVARLHSTTSTAVIKELKVLFARFGIPHGRFNAFASAT